MNRPSDPTEEGHRQSVLARASYWFTPASVLLFATLLMEGLWFYLWMVWLGRWGGFNLGEVPLTPVSIVLLLWTSYHTVRVLGQQRWSTKKARIAAGWFVAGLLILVVRLENGGGYGLVDPGWMRFAALGLVDSFPTAIHATFLGGTYLWWRGYRLAYGGLYQEQVLHSFLVGLGGIILGLLVWEVALRSSVGFEASRGDALVIIIAFFVAGLSALALSHLMQVRADMVQLEGAAQIGGRWSLVLPGVIIGMLMIGGIVAALFSFDLWSPFLQLLSLVLSIIAFLLYYLMMPFAYLAEGVIYAVRWLISLMDPVEQPSFRIPDLSALRLTQEQSEAAGGVPFWVTLLKWGVLLFVAGLLVYFLARLLSGRRRSASQEGVVEIHESVGSWRDFVRDVLLGLFLLLFWFRDRGQRVRRQVRIPFYSRPGGLDPEMEVRELYRRLLEEGRVAGFPRKERETPFEYQATLERRLPADQDALARITQDYVAVRYGEQAMSSEERGLLNRLWGNVYTAIRILARRSKGSDQ